MVELVRPSAVYMDSFIEAVREFQADKQHQYLNLDIAALEHDFESYIQGLRDRVHTPPQPGWVPDTILWLVAGSAFIGQISIRHRLTPNLRKFGGHIGYEIRPTQRRKGYGTQMLRLALPVVRELGITHALITCDTTNTGSRKIIEANGGELEDVIQLDFRDTPTMRWWIDLE